MTDQPERPQVDPSPVPTAFSVGSVRADDGTPVVVLQVQTPVGNAVYFLDPGIAVGVGNALPVAAVATEPKPVRPDPGVPEGGASWVDWLILAFLVIGLVSMLVVAAVG